MKKTIFALAILFITNILLLSCNTAQSISGSHEKNSSATVKLVMESYNEFTMDLDPVAVMYTIDISTEEGQLKLKNTTLLEAEQLALVECLIKNNCATLFNPQFTHLKKGKDILRVTVYGFPARYKKAAAPQDIEEEYVEETEESPTQTVKKTKSTIKKTTSPSKKTTSSSSKNQRRRRY